MARVARAQRGPHEDTGVLMARGSMRDAVQLRATVMSRYTSHENHGSVQWLSSHGEAVVVCWSREKSLRTEKRR